jgi:hypothetical protein
VDLSKQSDDELAWMQMRNNDWYARHARRLLQERAQKGGLNAGAKGALMQILEAQSVRVAAGSTLNPTARLRALWTLHAGGALDAAAIGGLLKLSGTDVDRVQEDLRAWSIQFACERGAPDAAIVAAFTQLAREDRSAVVRLYLASACQRLSLEQRLPILEALLQRKEDAEDHNLPLLEWYALEPVIAKDPTAGALLLEKVAFPQVREFIARRMAAVAQAQR